MRMRSSNPVLRQANTYDTVSDRPVTYTSVATKTLFLIGLAVLSAFTTIYYFAESLTIGWIIGSVIIAFIAVIVGSRSMRLAPAASVIYALAEGVLLGVVSFLYHSLYDGIIVTAISTTVIIFFIMLLLFSTNVIKVNQKFASFMVVALMGVIFMSLLSILFPSVFISSGFFYIIVIISAALSCFFLLLDFQYIKTSVDAGMDNKVSWMLSLGLLVTLVWIYFEMLRLLAIFGGRD